MNPSSENPPSSEANILAAIADAGVALLSGGAEVSRVEDTMERLAQAYRLGPVEVVVLPTALFLYAPHNTTVIRRIRRRAVNLAVVASINQLSRDVAREPIPGDELARRIRAATHDVRYPAWAHPLFAAGAAALISQLMGGRLADLLPAAWAGALARMVHERLQDRGMPASVADLLAAAVAVLPALLAAGAGDPRPGSVLVGGIMVLAPGLLLTSGVRDGIAGDLLSAAARLLDALLSAGAIASGASLPLYLYLSLGGRWPS